MYKKLYYGAAYYPELWDEKTFHEDLALMKEAGINVVRMGEFAWSTMEPHHDDFHVEFFVNIIKQFYENGIETIICTPTATPPIWISHDHPERMLCDENGTKMSHGGRQQVCTNNVFFRERAKLIIERMAKVYGSLPGVIGWQIDNECKGNVSECFCETCNGLWHQWLKNKYGTIEKLNHAWGTHVWSQHYESFEQVPTPMKTPAGHTPSLMTAYRLFSRELVAEFVNEQVDIIRKYSELPITHNSSLNHYIDNEKTFERLDITSFDQYSTSDNYNYMLTYCDVFKTLKQDKPFWVMETAASFSGCIVGYQPVHKNGYIKAEAAAAYALGASGFNYWLWRQQRSGFEQTHGSVVHSWGKPTVGFTNVVETGKLREKLEKVLLKTVPAKAELAVTYSDKARVFFMSEPLDWGFNYVEEMMKWHHMVLDTGVHSDFVFENGSISHYKVLMTPFLPYVSEAYIQKALDLVDNGGIWIVGPITGIRTEEHTMPVDYALGKLENLAGVETVYHYPMTGSDTCGIYEDIKAPLALWSSIFDCISAKAVGFTEGGVTPNMPFITECERGKGKIVMLGAKPAEEEGTRLLRRLLSHYAEEAGITLAADVTKGTIVVPRKGEGLTQLVIVNMDGKGGEVTITPGSINAFTKERLTVDKIKIEPYGCEVIEY